MMNFTTRAMLLRPISPEEMVSIFMIDGVNALPNIALSPITASLYFRFKSQFETELASAHLSPAHAFANPMRILAKTRIGSEHMLRVFHCFDDDVYYGILLSIVIISCVITVHKKSWNAWLNTFWAYSTSLLSEYSYLDKTLIERYIWCPWLIISVILLGAFSGTLRGQILKGEDIHWIDSLRDLYEWKDITKLQFIEFSDFNNYLVKNDTDIVRKYFNTKVKECYTESIRINIMSETDSDCQQVMDLDYKGLIEGTTAMILHMKFIEVIKQMLFNLDWKENVDYHVSEWDDYPQPVFSSTNKLTLEKQYEEAWDNS